MKRAVVAGAMLGLAMVAASACSVESDGPPGAPTSVDGGDADGGGLTDAATAENSPLPTLSVELGTGSASFVPLKNGDDVAMVRGKQGFQHVWISARILHADVREAVVTIATTQPDGRPGGPDLSAAVTLEGIAGTSDSEKVGLTGLVDYGVQGELVHVRLEVRTASGLFGFDERIVHVLPPVEYRCTSNVSPSTCAALCGSLACTACEIGVTGSGYLRAGDASTTIASCADTFELDPVQTLACCCCR